MKLARINEWFRLRSQPFYRAWVATVSALIFGLAPILCAWISFTIHGEFRNQYASTLDNGDALMIATSLVGPAIILAFKKREPETMFAPQLVALIGIAILLVCLIVFLEASPKSSLIGTIEKHRVLLFTYTLLPASMLYALWISYLDERCSSLKEFQKVVDTNGKSLQIAFPGGNGK